MVYKKIEVTINRAKSRSTIKSIDKKLKIAIT
jgi:hypothetical protein